MIIASHSGDLGDIISALPIVRQLGGGELILTPHVGPGGPREPMTKSRADFLLPLLLAQPYITAARFEENPQGVAHDLSTFRANCRYQKGELLTHWHARHVGFTDVRAVNLEPWLHVKPSAATQGKVVVARSLRYHNPLFRWQAVLDRHAGRVLFIGLPDEHAAFERKTARHVPHWSVTDALEMASLIAGSALFVGNQSFCCWLAMAMGHRLIQETWSKGANSQIRRPNAQFVLNHFRL